MSHAGKTKEEKYVVRAYYKALELGDPYIVMDKYIIGIELGLGLHAKGLDSICNQLAQANFIKKVGKTEFHLTANGIALATRVIGS